VFKDSLQITFFFSKHETKKQTITVKIRYFILDLEFRRLKSFAVQNEFMFEELEQFVGDGYDVFDIAIELANFVINGTLKQFVRVKNVGDFDSMLDLHDDTNIDDIRIMYKVNDRKLCTE